MKVFSIILGVYILLGVFIVYVAYRFCKKYYPKRDFKWGRILLCVIFYPLIVLKFLLDEFIDKYL